jgi:membrane fusion protein (multidrug efflux system)
VGGAVLRVPVQDNGQVKRDDLLLVIDDADYRVKLQQAEAELAAAQAAVAHAGPVASEDAIELDRTRRLNAQGAAPKQQLDKADAASRASRASLLQAQGKVAAAEAAAALAKLQLGYTTVVSPGDGTVSDLTAHVGQILAPDQPFAQFVPDRTYVVANFKETQTGAMRPGQRASVSIDAYPHRSFEGRVESLSAATGAQFSLLPPNNATGNFVKVVQRVPVRIELVDPPDDVVLRSGLSANVTVYVR